SGIKGPLLLLSSIPYVFVRTAESVCSLSTLATNMSGNEGKEMTIEIQMEEGEPLGATPNDKMIITKVQAGTLSEGKLQIGDQILRVNDTIIKDTHHFFALLHFAPPCARLLIFRDEKKAEELMSRVHIPADRERNITRRDGFSYELVKMAWKAGGPKLGLGIKHFQNRVLVSKTDQGSTSAECLKVGDHIVDIDSQPVTDKDVARGILVKGLQAHGSVTMVVERPETMEAKHWTQRALMVQAVQPPSVQMNSDVRDIAQKERGRLASKVGKQIKSILGGQKRPAAVAIDDRQFGHVIASDNEGKNLRAVKK
ncbi:hypothetical protein PMAYCL1PPCAC_20365, partial [Pristionchus mayeri]